MKIKCPNCHKMTYMSKIRCPFADPNLRVCSECNEEVLLDDSFEDEEKEKD